MVGYVTFDVYQHVLLLTKYQENCYSSSIYGQKESARKISHVMCKEHTIGIKYQFTYRVIRIVNSSGNKLYALIGIY